MAPVERPWRGWRAFRNAWLGLLGLLAVLFPVWAVDYCVMAPTALLIAAAIGPLNGMAARRPICNLCGLRIEEMRNGHARLAGLSRSRGESSRA